MTTEITTAQQGNQTTTSNNAANAASSMIAAAAKVSKDFSLITVLLTVMGTESKLGRGVSEKQLSDTARSDIGTQVVKVSASARTFAKAPMDSLESIRSDITALLEGAGVKVPGLNGTYFVPNKALKKALTDLQSLKGGFEKVKADLLADYARYRAETEADLAKIADPDLRAAALAKVPTKEDVEERTSLSIQVFAVATPDTTSDPELQQALAATQNTTVLSAAGVTWERLTKPFKALLQNAGGSANKHYRLLMRNAVAASMKSKVAAETFFGGTEDGKALKAFELVLAEVSAKFVGNGQSVHPELSSLVKDKFWEVAQALSSEGSVKQYLQDVANGKRAGLFADGFNILAQASMLEEVRRGRDGASAPEMGDGKAKTFVEDDLFANVDLTPAPVAADGAEDAGVPAVPDAPASAAPEAQEPVQDTAAKAEAVVVEEQAASLTSTEQLLALFGGPDMVPLKDHKDPDAEPGEEPKPEKAAGGIVSGTSLF